MNEKLRYQGKDMTMCSTPLGTYFAMGGIEPCFKLYSTALWRGYLGSWEIVDDRLYLIRLTGNLGDWLNYASLATIFPEFPDRVFAHWYSGTICIPQGKLREYCYMGYVNSFKRDLFLNVEQGVVVINKVRHNGTTESDDTSKGFVFPSSDNRFVDKSKFSVKCEHLQEHMTVPEIERCEVITDPLNAVPALPFGHLNSAWQTFLSDHANPAWKAFINGRLELWSFSARRQTQCGEELQSGYVVVRDGVPGPYFLTIWQHITHESEEAWKDIANEAKEEKNDFLSYILAMLNDLFVTDNLTDKDMINYAFAVRDKVSENLAMMTQIANNTLEQAMLGDFPKAIDDAVMDSNDDQQEMMMQYLSNPELAKGFARIVFDILKGPEV